jgi:hypothetical protein
MVRLLLLGLLLEPVILLSGSGGSALGLALDLDGAGLVRLELVGDVRLLGGLGWGGRRPLLYVSVRVAGLDRRRLVALEFAEVQVLNEVRCLGEKKMLAGNACFRIGALRGGMRWRWVMGEGM